MFGKLLFVLVSSIFILSCAKPNYVNKPSFDSDPQQKNSDCSLVFLSRGYCLKMQWEKIPTEEETGSFLVQITSNDSNTPILQNPNEEFAIVLWMPSMGHGSTPVKLERISSDTFRASEVFFIMHGEWEIRFQLKNGNAVIDQAIKQITI